MVKICIPINGGKLPENVPDIILFLAQHGIELMDSRLLYRSDRVAVFEDYVVYIEERGYNKPTPYMCVEHILSAALKDVFREVTVYVSRP